MLNNSYYLYNFSYLGGLPDLAFLTVVVVTTLALDCVPFIIEYIKKGFFN